MPQRPKGVAETHAWKDGRTVSFYLRVPVDGTRVRVDLGTNHEGWSLQRAEVELEKVMGQIERGTWAPPTKTHLPIAPNLDETLQMTTSRFWEKKKLEIVKATKDDYRWRIDYINAGLGTLPTVDIQVEQVDELKRELLANGLSGASVNMILAMLAQILDDAVDRKLIEVNPARGKRRRAKVTRPRRSFLEPDMLADMLSEASAWEAGLPEHQRNGRRALVATLAIAGPRITEALTATRGRLDIHEGRLRIGEEAGDVKTEAGYRDIEFTAFLLKEIRAHLAGTRAPLRELGAYLPLFHTRGGNQLGPENVRRQLRTLAARVNAKRAKAGKLLLPPKVTPHTMRRTFATLAAMAGRDPRWVMGQLGHTDARFTLSVYSQVMQRKRIDYDLVWRLMRFPDEQQDWPGPRASSSPTTDPLALGTIREVLS